MDSDDERFDFDAPGRFEFDQEGQEDGDVSDDGYFDPDRMSNPDMSPSYMKSEANMEYMRQFGDDVAERFHSAEAPEDVESKADVESGPSPIQTRSMRAKRAATPKAATVSPLQPSSEHGTTPAPADAPADDEVVKVETKKSPVRAEGGSEPHYLSSTRAARARAIKGRSKRARLAKREEEETLARSGKSLGRSGRSASAHAPRRVTVARSPRFHTVSSSSTREARLSSTSRELLRVEAEKKEAKRLLARSRRHVLAAKAGKGPLARGAPSAMEGSVRSSKELTIPSDVPLRTARRARSVSRPRDKTGVSMPTKKAPTRQPGAWGSGPPSRSSSVERPREVTEPKPFKFHSRMPEKTEAEPFQSIREQAEKFQFRDSNVLGGGGAESKPFHPTEPKPFKFQSEARIEARHASHPRIESTEEREAREAEEARKAFHARPFDKEAMAVTAGGVGMGVGVSGAAPPRPPTVPESPAFATDARQTLWAERKRREEEERAAREEEEKRRTEFHARPMPDFASTADVLDASHTKLAQMRSAAPLTSPHSPVLATSRRVRAALSLEDTAATQPRAAENTQGQGPTTSTKKWTGRPTVPEPFSLASDARGQRAALEMERRRRKEERESRRRRIFRARSVGAPPTSSSSSSARVTASKSRPPPPPPPTTTVPKPFSLRSEARHAAYRRELQANVEKEQQKEAETRKFRARPIDAGVKGPGFRPAPSTRPPTQPDGRPLRSDNRAQARARFEDRKRAKQESDAEQQRQIEQERQEREAQELKRKRRTQLAFKARPLPKYLGGGTVASKLYNPSKQNLQNLQKEQENPPKPKTITRRAKSAKRPRPTSSKSSTKPLGPPKRVPPPPIPPKSSTSPIFANAAAIASAADQDQQHNEAEQKPSPVRTRRQTRLASTGL